MKILIATRDAAQAQEAIHVGNLIQQMTGGTLSLITVIKSKKDRTQAEALLSQVSSILGDTRSQVQTRIRIGKTVKEIVREAKKGEYDLLVVGESVQRGVLKRFTSPKAKQVLAQMPCPVLVARGQPQQIQRLLVCESGRQPSLLNRLVKQLSPLLEHITALTILHVMSQIPARPGVPGWELRAEAQELIEKHTREGQLLQEDLECLECFGATLDAKVRHGLVVNEIVAEAQSGNYDLVVIGAHQAEGWARFLLDDLAYELVTLIDRPLLVV